MRVWSIDLAPPSGVTHPAVTFLRGDARELGAVLTPDVMRTIERPLLVVDDASHVASATTAVLEFFDEWLQPGEFIVVEDGILTAMRVEQAYDGGPLRAIHDFVSRSDGRYEIDRALCDYFGTNVTWSVDGYLRRVA
jgi:cephalosporin hydroxylase